MRSFVVRFSILMMMAVPALAASGNGKATGSADESVVAADPARVRDLGNDICRGAVDVTTQLGETFRQLSVDVLPKAMEATRQVADDLQPALERLGDRMRDLGRQLQQSKRQWQQDLFERPLREGR